MTERPGWRPENTLMLAVLVVAGAVLAAVAVMLAGVMRGDRVEDSAPITIPIVVVALAAGYFITAYGRKVARKNRPEWLETQAWQKGLLEKLEKGRMQRESAPETPAETPRPNLGSQSGSDQGAS